MVRIAVHTPCGQANVAATVALRSQHVHVQTLTQAGTHPMLATTVVGSPAAAHLKFLLQAISYA